MLAWLTTRIVDNARQFKLPVLDLRVVCSEIADYSNEIEPSAAGGAKIAEAICQKPLSPTISRDERRSCFREDAVGLRQDPPHPSARP